MVVTIDENNLVKVGIRSDRNERSEKNTEEESR